ncbi:MAG: hypothetical protein LBV74_14515 [Tannerella sp.]|jgi:hypothetical protein|nr:hypothetical protein [Tannerella sp.]
MDVIYSNTYDKDIDASDTMYVYSENKYYGRGVLFVNNTNTLLDKLSYQSSTEKPEWHYIRLKTKWESNAKVYNDIIMLDGLKESYTDRFFNGGSIDVINGIANVQMISCN